MKKKTMILLTAVLCASVGALVMFLNRPYKPVSFTVDGDQWSAKTVDGDSLLLELHNDNKSREWSIVSEPETFVSDYHNIAENISEFHIIALEDGNGEMVFQCVKDDGSADMYTLGLSISRHQKTNLQIDYLQNFRVSETEDGRKIDRNSERTAENRECARKFTRNGNLFFLPFCARRLTMGTSDLCAGRYAHRWRTDHG